MNATESLLTLYRAARDFTRRAVSAEELERAAIAHAEARGWSPRSSSEREKRLRERVAMLEEVLRSLLGALQWSDGACVGCRERPCACDLEDAREVARKVLG